MAVEIPTALQPPPAGQETVSERQKQLDAILNTGSIQGPMQKQVRDTFALPDLPPEQLKQKLDPLPVDDATKHNLWNTYYIYETPKPKPAPAELPQPPGILTRIGNAIVDTIPTDKIKKMPTMAVPPSPSKIPAQSFDTKLTPAEETQFQTWKAKYAPKDSGQDYDLRGAFKAGLTPDPATGHWPDTFKKPNHPTFSNESQYAAFAPEKVGHWDANDNYMPPAVAATQKPVQTSQMLRERQPVLEVGNQPPMPLPPPPVPFSSPALNVKPRPPVPQKETTWLDALSQLPGGLAAVRAENAKKSTWEAFRDTLATVTKMGGGLLHGGSLGGYDPEKGTINLPESKLGKASAYEAGPIFGGDPKKRITVPIHHSLSDVLQNFWGVPADVAHNPDPGSIGNFVGTAYTWGKVSKAISSASAATEAMTVAKLGSEGIGAKTIAEARPIVQSILKNAGIQAATGETIAHLEKPPNNETPGDREIRAGKTALYGVGFSVLLDSMAHLLAGLPKSPEGTVTGEAQRTVDDVINDVYDAFYKSGSFSSEESARTAATRAFNSAMKKSGMKAVTPEEFLDSVNRRFEANKAAAEPTAEAPAEVPPAVGAAVPEATAPPTPAIPGVPKPAEMPPVESVAEAAATEAATPKKAAKKPEIPSVPTPKAEVPIPPPTAEVEKPETPPKPVTPEELGIKPPKKQFTHAGQFVVGTSEGKIVLADGSLVERAPSYIKTLGMYGYKELTPEQIAGLSGLAAANKGTPAPEAPVAPIAETPPPLEEQTPEFSSIGEGPKLKNTREGRVPPPIDRPPSNVPPVPEAPVTLPETPGTYIVRGGEVSPVGQGAETEGDKWAKTYTQDQYKNNIRGAVSTFNPPEELIPSFEEVRNIYSKMMDIFPGEMTRPQMVDQLVEARVHKQPYPGSLRSVTEALGMPQPEGEPELPAVPESETSIKPQGTQELIPAEPIDKGLLGPRWTVDRSLDMEGESWLDGEDADSANAGIRKNDDESYSVETRDGEELGPFPTMQAAAAAAERKYPQANVTPKAPEVPKAIEGPKTAVPEPISSPRQDEIKKYQILTDKAVAIFEAGESIDNPRLTQLANEAFGGTRGQGKYDPKDAYDAIEAAVNIVIRKPGFVDFNDVEGTLKRLEALEKQIPRQADRTEEGVEFQQFSTPPAEAFSAVLGAGIRPGMTVLEPSAGTGNIATMMQLAGGKVITNEITPRRQTILEMLGFQTHAVDAQYLNNLLPFDVVPDVIVMNPPFSSTGGRTKAHKTIYGAEHVTQALARLKPGGRVVAIVGRGMAYGRPTFDKWWDQIERRYTVRANIGINGRFYGKYGTGFDNQILVIDKTGPTPGASRAERISKVLKGEDLSPADAAKILGPLGKEDIAERISQQAKSASGTKPQKSGTGATSRLPTPPPIGTGVAPGQRGSIESPGGNGTPAGRPTTGGVELPGVPEPTAGTPSLTGSAGAGELAGAGQLGGPLSVGVGGGTGEPAASGNDAGGLEAAGETEQVGEAESEVYSQYVTKKARFAGAQSHRANIVESATMASVDPPDVTYKPNLPQELVTSGGLSDVQLEAVTYAGQRHQVTLASGKRAGYWVGDGTGVGKGREISGILYDNLKQGRKRALWFSATAQLRVDAQRDIADTGLPMDFMAQEDTKAGGELPDKDGIVFSTYSMASQAWNSGRPRLQQLVNWVGKDFDGVIVWDECFVWETLVMTDLGPLPIGTIVDKRLNVKVLSWDSVTAKCEWKTIVRWLPRKLRGDLVRVTHETGSFVCTPDHKIWTEDSGYIRASEILNHHLRLLQEHHGCSKLEKQKTSAILRYQMLGEVANETEGHRREKHGDAKKERKEKSATIGGSAGGVLCADESEQSSSYAGSSGTNHGEIERSNISLSRWQRDHNCSAENAVRATGARTGVYDYSEGSERSFRVGPDTLQCGFGDTGVEDSNRGRWAHPQNSEVEVPRPPENGNPEFSRVVGVEILERGDLVRLGSRSLQNRIVYDIEVEDNHNYYADGVLVSNCHLMKNAVQTNQGGDVPRDAMKQEGTNSGAMGLALDEMFPNARIVYVSATGATLPRNMAYMSRLGLWGPGAPFPSFVDFLSAMAQGGVGAMEMLARDLKAVGSYISRSISYRGVGYEQVEHALNADEVQNYNHLADVWSEVLQAFGEAAKNAGAPKNAKNRLSAFYGAQQRFFLQVLTSLQLPDLFEQADKDIDEGRSVVISLYNTNEGQVAKKVAEAQAAGVDLNDLDFTPREILINLVSELFPVEQWTTEHDPVSGKDVQVPLKDAAGNPVINRENMQKKEELLDRLADIKVPENPLDAIVNHFGAKNISEVTGRKKRLENGEYVARKIKDVPLKERDAMEVKRFQDGKTHVAIISGKASAGISLHSSTKAANQSRRVFYAMQLSWSADKQMQSFGRVHRSDQVEPPIIKLVLTSLKGQQRLVNTVASRLASLGALTEGSRESKGGGLFAIQDITDQYGVAALGRTYADIQNQRISGIVSGPQLLQRMGVMAQDGTIKEADLGNVERFLNRIMALHVDEQNGLFNHFFDIFQTVVNQAKEGGSFDSGVTKIKADNIEETAPAQVIYTDPKSGARTSLLTLSGDFPVIRMPFSQIMDLHGEIGPDRAKGFHKNLVSGRLYSSIETRPDDYGLKKIALYSPKGGYSHTILHDDLQAKYAEVPVSTASNLWTDEYNQTAGSERKPIYIINGAIFPIYDRVMGSDGLQKTKVVRADMKNGGAKIGLQVSPREIESLKQRLGIGTPLGEASPKQVYDLAKNGAAIELDNGWEIKQTKIHGETRIELDPGSKHVNKEEMNSAGVITETINYSRRYFIPLDDADGPEVLGKILTLHKAVRDKTSVGPSTKSKSNIQTSSYVTEPAEDMPTPIQPPMRSSGNQRLREKAKAPMVLKPPITVNGEVYPTEVVKVSSRSGLQPVSGWLIAPGLAVTESLDADGKYVVTHIPSGLAAKTGIETLNQAVGIAKRLAPVGDWTRSKDEIMADKDFMKAVAAKLESERGSIRLFNKPAPPPIPPGDIPSPDHDMQKLVALPGPQGNIWEQIKRIPGDVKRLATSGRYNEDIKDFPVFAERVRRAQEIVFDASGKAHRQIYAVLKGLHPTEYDVFRAIVFWEDMYETAARSGEDRIPLQGTNKLDRIEREVERLRGISTPVVLDSVDKHHAWMEEMWDDFVKRGKVDPQDGRVKYFPNMILHDVGDALDRIPGLPMRMQNPRRLYLKERKGHQKPHNADYIRVMEQYATRAYAHNMIDDFIDNAASENDVLPTLTEAEKKQMFAPSTGEALKPGSIIHHPDGRVLKAFQFNPGRVIYPVQAINEAVIRDAVNAGLDELAIDLDAFRRNLPSPQLDTVMEEPLTHTVFALGQQRKVHLLPIEIADKLEHFRDGNQVSALTTAVKAATKAWKISAITFAGPSYHINNLVGDEITAYMEDLGSLAKQPEALKILKNKLTPPQYQQLVQMIEDARIWNSTFFSSGDVPRAIDAPQLRQYRQTTKLQKLNPFGSNPIGDAWREYQRYSNIREAVPRVAKFLADLERIRNGQPVVTKGVNLAGLDPQSLLAVGKVAREFNRDFGAVSPRMRLVYSTFFPFLSYHVGIVGPWLRRAAHKGKVFPGDEFLLKIVLPLIILPLVWNHFMYPDVEEKLPDWMKEMRHINTPFTDEKGHPQVITLETPVDIVMRWGGLHTLEANFDRYSTGRWTAEEAAKQQLEDIFGHQDKAVIPTAPGAVMEQMLNPMVKIMTDLKANKDSFTGQQIVSTDSPNLWGDRSKAWPQTATGQSIYREYMVKKLISPYMQMLRASQSDSPDTPLMNWLTTTGPFGWKKALGIRSVNPDAGTRGDWYTDRNWNQALYDEKMQKVADAYVEYASGNITQEERDAQIAPLLDQAGPNPTFSGAESDVAKLQQRPQFRIRVLEEMLRHETDPVTKLAMEDKIRSLRYQVDKDNYESTSKAVKPMIGLPPVPVP